jgi:nitrite reductase/ring-hydroxylating ferredoxin subunit
LSPEVPLMARSEASPTRSARNVPHAMGDPRFVPRERYYDREFFELEKERLWPRVWQMACREEEIPEPGDFVEYEICGQSILLVRQRDRSVKAFHNACRHRATELCKGSGQLRGGQIVCPFHGWRWNLDGSSSFVYGGRAFDADCLRAEDIRLQECRVDHWGACVWINMDPGARPLREALSPAAEKLDDVGVEKMRVWWWKETIVEANWKLAQEAFLEGFHVMATHPQLTYGAGEKYPWDTIEYSVFENGHSRFRAYVDAATAAGAGPSADEFLLFARSLQEGQDAMTLERDVRVFEGVRNRAKPGQNFAEVAIAALFEYAAGAGIPLAPTAEGMALWGGEIFLFPNYFMLPMYENALCYRVRPHEDDPERSRFEVWSLTMYPKGREPGRATLAGRFAPDDAENWGLIPRQDFSNMARQQRGLHSKSFRQMRLSSQLERSISNMHEELDRYLAG